LSEQREFRIFVSSPSDVRNERERIDRVVARLAGEVADTTRLTAVRWEQSYYTAAKTFQQQIPLPSQTDLVVCIFWKRLGSELPPEYRRPDGTLPTGTEYEFEDAMAAARDRGTPDVLVYRKTADVLFRADQLALESAQFSAFEAFWRRWFVSQSGHFTAGYHSFATTDEFETLIEAHIRAWLERQHALGAAGVTWPVAIKGSPFRGLEAFDEAHAPVFFGRRRVVELARERLVDAAARTTPFLLIIGMSGAGKSSVALAGLIPRLIRPGAVAGIDLWRRCLMRPSEGEHDPLRALARALYHDAAIPELAAGDSPQPEDLAALMRTAPDAAGKAIGRALARTAKSVAEREGFERPLEARLLIVIDQLEELFALPPETVAGFACALTRLVASGSVWLIATMRSDFYAAFQAVPELMALKEKGATFDLMPPTGAEIEEIVTGPARAAGLTYEVRGETRLGLDQELLAAAASPGSLPLLQFTLDELFAQREASTGMLTVAAYDRLGGLAGAIERRAEATFSAQDAAAQGELAGLLREIVTITAQGIPAGRALPRDRLAQPEARGRLVDAFVAARLLVADGDRALIHLAHEALISSWPRARDLIAANRDFLRARARIEAAASQWEAEHRDADFLLPPGRPLAEAAEMLVERRDALAGELVAFIEASAAAEAERREAERRREEERLRAEEAAKRERLELEAAAARERADAAVRLARRTRLAAIAVSLLLALAVAAAFYALDRANYAQEQRAIAQTRAEEAERNFAAALTAAANMVDEVQSSLRSGDISAEEAQTFLAAAEDTLGELTKVKRTPQIAARQIDLLLAFARTLAILGDTEQALESAEEAKRIATQLLAEDTGEAQGRLAASHAAVGDILTARGDRAGALNEYRAAREIAARRADAAPSDMALLRELSLIELKIADAMRPNWRRDEALAAYRAIAAVRERIVASDPSNITWQRDLAIAYERIGDLLIKSGRLDEALAILQKRLAIGQKLAADNPRNAELQLSLSYAHNKIGDIEIAAGRPQEALEAYLKALAIRRRVAAADAGNMRRQLTLSSSYALVGSTLALLGRSAEALERLGTCLDIRRRLAALDPGNSRWQRELAQVLGKIGDVRLAAGDIERARAAYDEMWRIDSALAALHPDDNATLAIAASDLARLGDLKRRTGDEAGARADYESCLAARRKLVARDAGNVRWLEDLAACLVRHSAVVEASVSRADLEEALAILAKLEAADELDSSGRELVRQVRGKLASRG
jgi:tetratricopeptide (TPR) repeat protein